MSRMPKLIKSQFLLAGLIALMMALFAFVSITVATSRKVSPVQIAETEPNNDFDNATPMYIPDVVMGSAWNSVTDTDYFDGDSDWKGASGKHRHHVSRWPGAEDGPV